MFYLPASSLIAGQCELLCKSEWMKDATYAQILERVVLYGENVDGTGSKSFFDPDPPLFVAASSNNLVAVSALLELGADVNVTGYNGWTPVFAAENFEIAKTLINADADLNRRNKFGWVPLHIIDNEEVWFLLKNSGANIRLRNEVGVTTIMTAQSLNIFEFLLAEGLDPLEVALDQSNALFYNTSDEVIVKLIDLGLDVNAVNNDGATPLHNNPNAGSLFALINAGANIYALNEKRETPLEVSWHRAGVLDVYCKTDPAIFEKQNVNGDLLLHLALKSYASSTAHINKIILCTKDLEITNSVGQTALHVAAGGFSAEYVQLLLDAGADAKATDINGMTPFDISRKNLLFNDEEIVWKLNEARFN